MLETVTDWRVPAWSQGKVAPQHGAGTWVHFTRASAFASRAENATTGRIGHLWATGGDSTAAFLWGLVGGTVGEDARLGDLRHCWFIAFMYSLHSLTLPLSGLCCLSALSPRGSGFPLAE